MLLFTFSPANRKIIRMLIKFKVPCQALRFVKSFSTKASTVKVSEQKVRVGSFDINYVKSSIEGEKPKKTLICLPGALGKKAFRRQVFY